MKKLLLVGLIGLALFGCKTDEEKAIDVGEKDISYNLYDADSAKFRELKFYKLPTLDGSISVGYVCGQVNAKNRMGAYVGFTPFYVKMVKSQNDFTVIFSEREPSESSKVDNFREDYFKYCRNYTSDEYRKNADSYTSESVTKHNQQMKLSFTNSKYGGRFSISGDEFNCKEQDDCLIKIKYNTEDNLLLNGKFKKTEYYQSVDIDEYEKVVNLLSTSDKVLISVPTVNNGDVEFVFDDKSHLR